MNSDPSVSWEKAETQGPEMTQWEVELNRNPSSQSQKMPLHWAEHVIHVCVCVCVYYFSVTHSAPEAKLHGREGKCHKKSQSPSQANKHDHPGIRPCLVLAQWGGSRLSLSQNTTTRSSLRAVVLSAHRFLTLSHAERGPWGWRDPWPCRMDLDRSPGLRVSVTHP